MDIGRSSDRNYEWEYEVCPQKKIFTTFGPVFQSIIMCSLKTSLHSV